MAVVLDNNIITSGLPDGFTQNNPAILYQNFFRDGGVLSSSGHSGAHVPENATTGLTYDFWRPDSLPATIDVELDGAEKADAAGIAFTGAGGKGCLIEVKYHNGSGWVVAADAMLVERVALFLFDEVEASRWRIRISGGSGMPDVIDVSLGKALRIERRIYQGFTPDRFAISTEYAVNRSRNGQRLGATVVREGIDNNVTFDNLTGAWVDGNLKHLINHIRRTLPFYWAWRPLKYSGDVVFAWGDGDVRPENSGPADYRRFSLSYEGIGPATIDGPQ